MRRILRWGLGGAAILLLAVVVLAAVFLRPESLRKQAVITLTDQLNLDVSLDQVALSLLPRPHLTGSGLAIRIPGRPDLPPFVSIERFSVDVGPIALLRRQVGTLHVDGLKIAVPPKDARSALPGTPARSQFSDASADRILVEHLISHNAELRFVPREADKDPLTFLIHDLEIQNLSFGSKVPFHARLTNPVPTGLVDTRGTFGPWRRDDPTSTPLDGEYEFTDADLSTINGIGGTLSSKGTYAGELTEITAKGTTDTPDFSLDLGGRPVPLTTTFVARINGTNGTTELTSVDAKLRNTPIQVTGAITNLPGPGRRDVNLQVKIEDGRIEDILALAIDSAQPMLVGDLSLESTLTLPPGKTRVPQRLGMTGRFGLQDARFTDADVQTKLRDLSRRSQGKDDDEAIGRVLTNLRGRFTVGKGTLTLPDLSFRVPGATVALAGVYGLESGAIDFKGTLRMQATVSRAVGGFKSIFLKPFDPIFRKQGAGAVLPIKITGTRQEPKMGLQVGKIFGG